jgi:indole-3-glycerol phosphate synthase
LTALDSIVAAVRARAAERRRKQSLARLQDLVKPDSWRRERFLLALSKEKPAILAECLRRSPAAGVLIDEAARDARAMPTRVPRVGPRWFALAQACQKGGAAALAVHTEEDHFGGALEDLRTVEFTGLARLRLDFLLDEGMVLESCVWGADAVALVPAVLDDAALAALRAVGRELGLAVLVEAATERDLERALELEPELAAVSGPSVEILAPWLARIPSGVLKVARAELRTPSDFAACRDAGADAVLTGTALARAADPEALLRALREEALAR